MIRKLNPALRAQVTGIQNGMADAAEAVAISDRFVAMPSDNGPYMRITDTETMRSVEIGLCDYRGVRVALAALFPAVAL